MTVVAKQLHMALAHHQAGRLEESTRLYRQILRIDPGNADALHLLGVARHQSGDAKSAVEYIRQAISQNPAVADFHNNLAAAYWTLGELNATTQSFQDAVRLDASYAEAHFNLGVVWGQQGLLDSAIESYQQAIQARPDYRDALNNLGIAFKKQGRLQEAIAAYEQAMQLDPNSADILNNLGNALDELEQTESAIDAFQRSIQLDPNCAETHNNLGNSLKHSGQYTEAFAAYRRALSLKSDYVTAWNNLGTAYQETGDIKSAMECYRQALEIAPNHAEANLKHALGLLLLGDLGHGWANHDWRWQSQATPRNLSEPKWDGRPDEKCRLLVYAEQGIGDEVMFASCIPDVLPLVGECVLECDPRLRALFARSFPNVQIVSRPISRNPSTGKVEPSVDAQIPIGSLPHITRHNIESFPKQTSYLIPDPVRVEAWRKRFQNLGKPIVIGISWRGGHDRDARRLRSTELNQWIPVLKFPDAAFVNLQYGECEAELLRLRQQHGIDIHDWTDADPLTDLDGFCAQVAALDLVISIDNSTVHMAGALGTPTWVLLPLSPDWRWMLDRNDSVWYPSLRLFRQPVFGDWQSLFNEVHDQLPKLVSEVNAQPTAHSKVSKQIQTPTQYPEG